MKKADPPPPIGPISDIFEIENILMAVDPLDRHLNLHICIRKGKFLLKKVKIKVDHLVKGIFVLENTKNVSLLLVFWMVPEGYF